MENKRVCEMRFEWDKNKNKSNVEKHGITFEEAMVVFSDVNSIYSFDRNVDGEIRQHILTVFEF